jgi:hypothetical protein
MNLKHSATIICVIFNELSEVMSTNYLLLINMIMDHIFTSFYFTFSLLLYLHALDVTQYKVRHIYSHNLVVLHNPVQVL